MIICELLGVRWLSNSSILPIEFKVGLKDFVVPWADSTIPEAIGLRHLPKLFRELWISPSGVAQYLPNSSCIWPPYIFVVMAIFLNQQNLVFHSGTFGKWIVLICKSVLKFFAALLNYRTHDVD